ncbi:MAG: cell division protein ZapA [Alphaproteobacteria bacterium]|nr:cell division protein ZapA [Alphaproteobacteria bacterium]
MAEVAIAINGRTFSIYCEDGQEQRVTDLSNYVDSRLKDIASAGAANSESHLLVLTSLMLSDEVFDLRQDLEGLSARLKNSEANQNDESEVAQVIDDLAQRIERLSARIKNAG